MIGFYNHTVVLTYLSVISSVVGIMVFDVWRGENCNFIFNVLRLL